MCVLVGTYMRQGTTFRVLLSASTMWVLGIKFRASIRLGSKHLYPNTSGSHGGNFKPFLPHISSCQLLHIQGGNRHFYLKFLKYFIIVCASVAGGTCHSTCVEVRWSVCGVASLLPPCMGSKDWPAISSLHSKSSSPPSHLANPSPSKPSTSVFMELQFYIKIN